MNYYVYVQRSILMLLEVFSKLMNYVINKFNVNSIYSYADLSWIDLKGTSYINSGFLYR